MKMLIQKIISMAVLFGIVGLVSARAGQKIECWHEYTKFKHDDYVDHRENAANELFDIDIGDSKTISMNGFTAELTVGIVMCQISAGVECPDFALMTSIQKGDVKVNGDSRVDLRVGLEQFYFSCHPKK